jgi:hypothetical protein
MSMRDFMLGIVYAVRDSSCFVRLPLSFKALYANAIPSFSFVLARLESKTWKQQLRTPDADDSVENREKQRQRKEKKEKTEVGRTG